MPTDYTATLMDLNKPEQDFISFALDCARAFGALYHLKDKPLGIPIPMQVEPDRYYEDNYYNALEKLNTWQKLTFIEKKNVIISELEKSNKSAKLSRERAIEENARIDRMLEQVRNYIPPSQEHIGYKNFMLDQLNISKHDLEYYSDVKSVPTEQELKIQIRQKQKLLEDRIADCKEFWARELERCEAKNRWLKLLRQSLAQEQHLN